MKEWQTPKPSGPVHPDSVRNQEKAEKASIFPLLYFCAAIAALMVAVPLVQEAYYYLDPEAAAAAQRENAAARAKAAEEARAKEEREYRLEWERRQAQEREAASAAKRDRELRLVDQCQSGIRAAAKVPRSVDFHFGYDFQDFPGGHAMVAQTFDAINGFGQKTTNEGRCVFGAQGELLEFWWNGVRQL